MFETDLQAFSRHLICNVIQYRKEGMTFISYTHRCLKDPHHSVRKTSGFGAFGDNMYQSPGLRNNI